MSKDGFIKELLILAKAASVSSAQSSVFKARQYNDAIRILENEPSDTIDNIETLVSWFTKAGKKNPASIVKKATEYLEKGYLEQAKEALTNPMVMALIELTKVANIGPAKAKTLYSDHGIVTVKDLEKHYSTNPKILNDKQAIGLKYHWDLNKRIPRDEIIQYEKKIIGICSAISKSMVVSINGSFRREMPDSGDIDILVTGPKNQNKIMRQKLIKIMTNMGLIVEVLASGNKKFMGISRLNDETPHRHIDIIDTDIDEYPFAQLYFTGSGGFNAYMRALALKEGYSMNEYCMSDKKTKEPVKEAVIQSRIGKSRFETEKDIFAFLKMDYVEPKNRNRSTLSKLM